MKYLLLTASALFLILAWGVTPASAHTDLVSISPTDGTRLEAWPSKVVLVFTEPVDPSLSTISITIGREPATRISSRHGASQNELIGDLRSVVPTGSPSTRRVEVNYRVTSADGHPIAGSSLFTVNFSGSDLHDAASDEGAESAGPTPSSIDAEVPKSGIAIWLIGGVVAVVLVSTVSSALRSRSQFSSAPERER